MRDLIYGLLIVAAGLILWPDPPRHHRAPSADTMTARELAGLVDIESWDEELILVSPRGVELPFNAGWPIDDVLDTLLQVDAL